MFQHQVDLNLGHFILDDKSSEWLKGRGPDQDIEQVIQILHPRLIIPSPKVKKIQRQSHSSFYQ